jgi:hypothetical protein
MEASHFLASGRKGQGFTKDKPRIACYKAERRATTAQPIATAVAPAGLRAA